MDKERGILSPLNIIGVIAYSDIFKEYVTPVSVDQILDVSLWEQSSRSQFIFSIVFDSLNLW